MPPRKGIVKSGAAGNSSKANKLPDKPSVPEGEKPLFPPGSKTPLSLLNERCQKNGWEKPIIDTRKQPDGFSFAVTLSQINKKTSVRDSVRFAPHPQYFCPTALEARHWGATYALYRFCNGIQLNRVLPAGPRDYWAQLASEHKAAPEHLQWMYFPDPFAAQKEVQARQAKVSEKRAQLEQGPSSIDSKPRGNSSSGEFAQPPEVKMASGLRDLVEDAIKKAMALYPEASDASTSILAEEDSTQVTQQLGLCGFTQVQCRNAVTFLSKPSPMATTLLSSLSPLEASIEYLILHLPECDLPKRFLPDINSSNPFVTSAHSGTDDLKTRWIEEKAIKEAGWPAHVVKECTSDPRLVDDWDLLITALGKKLLGEDLDSLFLPPVDGTQFEIDAEEAEALGAHFDGPRHLIMPLFSAPLALHVFISPEKHYPRPRHVPVYLASPSIPTYVRLHILAQLLRSLEDGGFLESGEGFCMAAMRVLEDEWAKVEDNGPPDMSTVLQHILPRRDVPDTVISHSAPSEPRSKGKGRTGARRRDPRSDTQIKADFDALSQKPEYREMLSSREKLPASAAKDEFLRILACNRVVVVVGETGCGKTTQLPQFILDSLILSGQGSNASIIVTQPRRLSAIGVASRVSAERLEDGSVGYVIRGESKKESRTKLLFCTTGVVLRRLSSGDHLKEVTHVVVDEVHERSVDSDFLLLELKELLKTHLLLKVVLMSATINHETFVKYFNGAPLLNIPGFAHPVTDKYLEDIVPEINYRPSTNKGSNAKQGFDSDEIARTVKYISNSDRIDYRLIAATVRHIVSTSTKVGGVLIFLSGVQEIRQCIESICEVVSGSQVDIFPLHANLSNDEQRRVFAKTSKWKIIASTNVAETSITIDDVIYVIDAGKVKETRYDPESNFTRLVETWVTRAAARQRRGRAGRTQPGICYKLYTRDKESNMAKFPVPEILRVPLESLSLTVKVTREEEDVKSFLSRAIDPPKITAMEKAWSVLEDLGAVDTEGKLTPLGQHISMIPVDLRLAKMLVLGSIFRCLGPILTIAASLSSKPLFFSPMEKRDEANKARARFVHGDSDLLTVLNAYNQCMNLRTEGKSQFVIRQFCEQNFISPAVLRDITTLRHDFLSALTDLGFIPLSSSPNTPSLNANSNNLNLLKAIILGGLYPRVARLHLPTSAIKFDKVQAGTVQRENTAKEFRMFDVASNPRDGGGRMFLHPSSVLFDEAKRKSGFVAYFHKQMTSKVFVRDVTEIPLYALLLFGGPVSVNHVRGGLTIGSGAVSIKLKALPRIGVLVNHLRRLLDAQLQRSIEDGSMLDQGEDNPVLHAMLALITHDGSSEPFTTVQNESHKIPVNEIGKDYPPSRAREGGRSTKRPTHA